MLHWRRRANHSSHQNAVPSCCAVTSAQSSAIHFVAPSRRFRKGVKRKRDKTAPCQIGNRLSHGKLAGKHVDVRNHSNRARRLHSQIDTFNLESPRLATQRKGCAAVSFPFPVLRSSSVFLPSFVHRVNYSDSNTAKNQKQRSS